MREVKLSGDTVNREAGGDSGDFVERVLIESGQDVIYDYYLLSLNQHFKCQGQTLVSHLFGN